MPEPSDKPISNFGLNAEQLELILSKCLKPEEINGPPKAQQERIAELVHWFARYAGGHANPKWAPPHAFELVYYIASHAINQHIDLASIRKDAYIQGLLASESDRRVMRECGIATEIPAEDFPARITALERQVKTLSQILLPTPA